jgi:hypothetical protein
MIPNDESITQNRYMAYITQDKLGLQKFPLTGNPYDSIALFAHPDGVIVHFKLFFLNNILIKINKRLPMLLQAMMVNIYLQLGEITTMYLCGKSILS